MRQSRVPTSADRGFTSRGRGAPAQPRNTEAPGETGGAARPGAGTGGVWWPEATLCLMLRQLVRGTDHSQFVTSSCTGGPARPLSDCELGVTSLLP